MKKNLDAGVLVINYLASCGKTVVATLDLVKAVVPGCRSGEEMEEAFGIILPVLSNLESGGLVKLSSEAIPSTGFVPKAIHILPGMKKTADRLMQDKAGGTGAATAGRGRAGGAAKGTAGGGKAKRGPGTRRKEAADGLYNVFVDLFQKKRKQVRIRGEWQRLISSLIWSDMEDETGFEACVKSFVNGMIWEKLRENAGPRKGHGGQPEKAGPGMRPELQRVIEAIVKDEEERNGALKEGRKPRRTVSEADAPLTALGRDEIKDFIHCLHTMRDGVQPGRAWRDAMSRFMSELIQHIPVYEACMESFRAGIVWQSNRARLEDQL